MLGSFEIVGIESIASSERRALAEHRVPGLAGNYLQDLGTVPNRIVIVGTRYGDDARDGFLTGIRELFSTGAPATFVADINTATDLTEVVLEDLDVAEVAEPQGAFRYRIALRKYVPPPEPPATGLLEGGIFDDALGLLDALDALDALASIPDLSDPTAPLTGALEPVHAAVGGLADAAAGIGQLFGGGA